jgi:hypothetical protein
LGDLTENLSLSWENDFLNIDFWNEKKVEIYRKKIKEKLKNLEDFLRKNSIWYKVFDTKMNVFRELYLFFSK